MVRERFLVFFLFISFVLFGCSITGSDDDEETAPKITTLSGKIDFPATAGTTASIKIRAKVDFTKYRVYINGVRVTLNDDGTFSGDVPEAEEYDIQVRFAGSNKAILRAHASKGEENKELEVDVKTTAKSLAYVAYKEQAGKSDKKFEDFKELVDEIQDTIDDLADSIENALKSLSNLESEDFDLEEDEEIKKKTEESAKKAEEEEAKQATSSSTTSTTTSSSSTSTTTAAAALPSGVLAINDGAEKTDSVNVTLNLTGITGTGVITMSVDGGDFETLNQAKTYTLSEGDGEKTITIVLKDDNGESKPIGDTIILETPPAPVPEVFMPKIAAGFAHALLLKKDKTVWAWGYNGNYQLGIGNNSSQDNPVQVGVVPPSTSTSSSSTSTTTGSGPLTDCIAVAGGGDHSLAIKSDGTMLAWGSNNDGQCGLGDDSDSNVYFPTQVLNLTDVIAIAAGYYHSLAVKSDGTAWAWGSHDSGQLGIGGDADSYQYTPVQVGVAPPTSSSSSTTSSSSSTTTGAPPPAPNSILPISGVIAVAAGYEHSLALRSDGTVWAWGYDSSGQLGDGNDGNSEEYFPVQVGVLDSTTTSSSSSSTTASSVPLTDVTAIAAGEGHSLALKSDGTVWAWGDNGYGQIGQGGESSSKYYVPVQVAGLSDVVAIAAGYYSSFALKSDGTAWGWGNSSYDMLGAAAIDGENHTPVQIKKEVEVSPSIKAQVDEISAPSSSTSTSTAASEPLTDIIGVGAGQGHSIFLKADDSYEFMGEFDEGG
ncbi:RCC1 domain-containing protein [Candidatus Riflebacteria bacterium]